MTLLRVFHGPIPVVGLPWAFSRAQRRLGHTSDYVLFDTFGSEWLLEGWDKNLRLTKKLISGRSFGINAAFRQARVGKFVLDCLTDYDVFHFYSGWSLFPGREKSCPLFPRYKDLPLLRFLGKKVVFYHIGCIDSKLRTNFSRKEPSLCKVCKTGIAGLCNDKETTSRCLTEKKYGHVIINGIPDMSDFDQEAVYVPAAIDLDMWKFKEVETEPKARGTKVIQVTGNIAVRGDVKGVRYAVQAIERLREDGYNIDLILIDKVPVRNMPSVIAEADIVIDNLLYGWYGLTAIEAMALGKPVIAYLHEPWLQFHCERFPRPPIIESGPRGLYSVLKEVISKEDFWRLGLSGRQYVEETHDPMKIGRKLIELYSSA